ncbi:MAG: class II aldolase/adducin family protein [Candidatus Saganbacteria bacterium]|nr:class II aldolase/adducin family protein [Candidatus Saganbacteria bacterium]
MLEVFQKIGKMMFQAGLVDAAGGSLSLLDGDNILITKKEAMLGDLGKDDLVKVGLEKGPDDEKAAFDLEAHRAVYKRGKVKAIVSAVPAEAIAISLTDNKIVPQDSRGLRLFKSASIVRVRDNSNFDEVVRLLPNFLGGENSAAAVKGQGIYAAGSDLAEAFRVAAALANSCKVLVAMRSSSSGRGGSGPSGGHSRGPGGGRGQRDKREFKSAIPPGIGVMGRDRYRKR